jgi:hypothetical protein
MHKHKIESKVKRFLTEVLERQVNENTLLSNKGLAELAKEFKVGTSGVRFIKSNLMEHSKVERKQYWKLKREPNKNDFINVATAIKESSKKQLARAKQLKEERAIAKKRSDVRKQESFDNIKIERVVHKNTDSKESEKPIENTRVVSVRLPIEVAEKIDDYCVETDISRSKYLSSLVLKSNDELKYKNLQIEYLKKHIKDLEESLNQETNNSNKIIEEVSDKLRDEFYLSRNQNNEILNSIEGYLLGMTDTINTFSEKIENIDLKKSKKNLIKRWLNL